MRLETSHTRQVQDSMLLPPVGMVRRMAFILEQRAKQAGTILPDLAKASSTSSRGAPDLPAKVEEKPAPRRKHKVDNAIKEIMQGEELFI